MSGEKELREKQREVAFKRVIDTRTEIYKRQKDGTIGAWEEIQKLSGLVDMLMHYIKEEKI